MKLEDILKNAKQGVLDTVNESNFDFEFNTAELFEGTEMDEDTKTAIAESLGLFAKEGVKSISEDLVTAIVESIKGDLEAFQDSVIEESQTKVLENLDFLVNKTSTEWLKENEEAVANRTKAGIMESFMNDLVTVVANHNISLDDEKVDIYDQMVKESEETKAFANSLADENKVLREEKEALQRKEIMSELTEGMVETSKEKFESLVEGLSIDSLMEKGKSLKAVFAPTNEKITITKPDATIINEAKINEGEGSKKPVTNKQTKRVIIK